MLSRNILGQWLASCRGSCESNQVVILYNNRRRQWYWMMGLRRVRGGGCGCWVIEEEEVASAGLD